MTTLLPLLALAIALAASLLSKPAQNESGQIEGGRAAGSIWVFVVSALLILIAYIWRGWSSDATHVALGIAVGSLGALLFRWAPAGGRVVAGIALAAACDGFMVWISPDWRLLGQLGAIAGAGLAGWLLDVRTPSKVSSAIFTIAVGSVVAADVLGEKAMQGGAFASSGALIAIAAAAAGVVGMLAAMRATKLNAQRGISVLLLALGVFVIGSRYLGAQDSWTLTLAGVVIGLAVNWLMDEEGADSVRPLIAAILWVGLATIGFALRRGYGMSLGLAGGVTTLLLLGNVRALLTIGPLAGLVMYRVFREVHVEATRALDIGQHYALVGFIAGALLPLMPVEWLRSRRERRGPRMPAAGVLWMLMLAAVPIALAVVMGPKGVVGFVAGLGLAALIESIRSSNSLQPLSLGIGLAAATTFIFQFLGDSSSLSRDEKIAILLPLATGLTIVVVVLLLVSPKAVLKEAKAL